MGGVTGSKILGYKMDHMDIYSCSVSKKSWIKSLGAAAVTLTVTREPHSKQRIWDPYGPQMVNYMGPIWETHMGLMWVLQQGFIWDPYGPHIEFPI